ncbi:transporter substrate-binding domain-containing protein [Thioclava sp. BHET1]|nr:transporter substrate-binding domain-containing protein [Thioclava sp. BHET1]
MKLKLMAAAAVAALGVAHGASADVVKIGVAAEPYPPFTTPDASGHWSGWEVDIMNAICADQKMDCKIVPVAWDGIIPALTSGQIDAIMSSMSITAEREKTIDFSNKYYNTPTVVVGPKDVKEDATPEGLAGKIIGVQVSTIHQVYAQKYFTKSTIKTYQTQDEVDQDLVAGRIDATQADSIALQAFLDSKDGACCEVKGTVKDDPAILGSGVGVGLRKGDTDLKAKFNKGIADIRSDGTYEKISKKYFDFNIYGS